ncbi:hypothetical protein FHX82_002105 [Amycolatopsis bartoniae]|uniref:Uncharacterized protein n=1 Tax=Amycolatopsis bartoniae TaxID=941986 RepID=A0A8H9IXK6_9PSEU|nr:hypothetical protein [Amycolatopsis bartoniae]MBB2935085.1 hypothetical protein [Amycolatopsis bartoniae]TVT02559.1 hypothetical protein FNH07_27160 [Amycolatopsis bartoniae]GHF74238.1 hypothetical protein GCM10017566_55030 [Amycolatopsis bartoniae]
MSAATDALTDPERGFLGCLMQLPAAAARRLLAGMRADDMAGAVTAPVLRLAIELAAADTAPAPVALYAHAITTGRAPGRQRREWLSGWLIDTYRDAPPPALADHLKTAVLEAAWRRALLAHTQRVQDAAETADVDRLHELADDTDVVDELWQRYHAARAGQVGTSLTARLGVAA